QSPLAGRRVLVVEDEYFLADDIERALQTLGASVVGPFGELKEAAEVVDRDGRIDVAVVDINLRTEMVFSLARALQTRIIPFLFTTGHDRISIESEFRNVRMLGTPLDIPAMVRELTRLI